MSQHGYPERLSGRSKVLQEEGMCQPTIELLVESLTGSAFQMTVSPQDTIYVIKTKIFRVEGIPISQQHLLYNLKELDDSASLSDYSIKDGCTLKLVLSIRGGPISTRRLPLPSADDIQWRDIRDFVENNRDEALEWLPPGCKVLVYRDGDNVNLFKVIEDDDEETYSPLSDYCFSEETAVTMCKMINLRSKMERLSMKRNKKKHQSPVVNDEKDERRKESPPLKKTLSEETLSSTINGLFDETPNFTKYKSNSIYNQPPSMDNASPFPSIFNINTYGKFANKNAFSDKYGLWPPIGSYSDMASNDNCAPTGGRTWRSTTDYFSRDSPTPADYLLRPANSNDCNTTAEGFADTPTRDGNLPSYSSAKSKLDSETYDFHEASTSRKDFCNESSLVQELADDVLGSEAVAHSNRHPKLAAANIGGGAPLLLGSTLAPRPPLPTPTAPRPLLLAHAANSGRSSHGEYRMARLLSNEGEIAAPERYDSHSQYYWRRAGPVPAQLKVRKVAFGSGPRRDPPRPPRLPEPHLSRSACDLSSDSGTDRELSVLRGDFTSSRPDCTEDVPGGTAAEATGMVFSSSASDLLGLKRDRLLPSLSRHRNCERLDVSDECLHETDVEREDIRCRPSLHDRRAGERLRGEAGFSGSPFGGKTSVETSDAGFRRGDIGGVRLDTSEPASSVRLGPDENLSRECEGVNRLFANRNFSRRNLEVGSERRCRRIRKIPKLDRDDLQERENRPDGVTRRHFLLGYGNRGYEAAIRKTPDERCLRIGDEANGRGYSGGEQFTPLYERCDRRSSGASMADSDRSEFGKVVPARTYNETVPVATVLPLIIAKDDINGEIKGEGKKTGRIRCAFCKKRLSVATVHTCRCGVVFCAPHRYAEVHGCHYDYKAEGQEYLRRANPLISAPKLPKI